MGTYWCSIRACGLTAGFCSGRTSKGERPELPRMVQVCTLAKA